eukprot:scaffold6420_cov168-Amphora_coffeaeformis.AAC.1
MLLFACDNTLYACDLSDVSLPAETNDPVILSVNTLPTLWQTTDEINQISWTRAPAPATTLAYTTTKGSRKKKKKPRNPPPCVWIATADDAGQIWLAAEPWENLDKTNITRLTHSTEEALCLTAVLRTTSKGKLELFSGGSDCRVVQWQQQSSHQWTQQSAIDVNQIEEHAGGPLWNPPMVHQMVWSSGTYVAAACGDGQVCLFQTNSGRFVLSAAVEHAAVPACAVAVGGGGTNYGEVDDNSSSPTRIPSHRLLWSAGNDGVCKLWDVGNFVAGMDAAQDEDLEHGAPRLLETLHHGAKPNALAVTNNGRLWVADTTCNITGYDTNVSR